MADWLANFLPSNSQPSDLEAVVHDLQAALERADVRNAVLQEMLDQAVERAETAEEDLKAAATALRWARSRPLGGADTQPRTGRRRKRQPSQPQQPQQQQQQPTQHGIASQPPSPDGPSSVPLTPLESFRLLLVEVLTMREAGAYDTELMRRYSDALVVLPDEDLREAYRMFTLVYTHEHDPLVLEWLQLGAVSDNVHNFIEVQVMKIATLLDQPEHVRAERHEREKRARAEQVSRQERMREEQAREAALLVQLHALDQHAYDEVAPLMRRLADGDGDEKSLKRYQRRRELGLLTMAPNELRERVPTFEWSQMMTSGLSPQEVRALAHFLRLPGVPPSSASFAEQVRQRISTFGDAAIAAHASAAAASATARGRRAAARHGTGVGAGVGAGSADGTTMAPPPLVTPSVHPPPAPPPPPPPPPPAASHADPRVPTKSASNALAGASAVPLGELQEAVRRRSAGGMAVDPRAVREQEMREEKRRAMRGKMMGLSNRLWGASSRRPGANKPDTSATPSGAAPMPPLSPPVADAPLEVARAEEEEEEDFEYI
jgi:hypothetical protein